MIDFKALWISFLGTESWLILLSVLKELLETSLLYIDRASNPANREGKDNEPARVDFGASLSSFFSREFFLTRDYSRSSYFLSLFLSRGIFFSIFFFIWNFNVKNMREVCCELIRKINRYLVARWFMVNHFLWLYSRQRGALSAFEEVWERFHDQSPTIRK